MSISRDRNIRYNFHGSRSRAKVTRFQPIPLSFFLYSPFKRSYITIKICKYLMNKKVRRRFEEIACLKGNTTVITRKLLNGRQLHKINTKVYSMLLESK